jgi:hypothetical protein
MGALDLVDWPADRTLALSGSAGGLKIPLALRNTSDEPLNISEATLIEVHQVGTAAPLRAEPLPLQLNLAASAVARTHLRLRLDAGAAPGRYEGRLELAGLSRQLAFDILPQVKLSVRPDPVVVDAAAGRRQDLAVGLENQGNLPLTIDLAGTYPVGEEIAIAPNRLDETDPGEQPLAALFDRVIGRIPSPVLAPFGAAKLAMPDGAHVLNPGETVTARVSIELPERLSPTARYHLFAPLYAADLHIIIVTAAKSPSPATPARRTGAKA